MTRALDIAIRLGKRQKQWAEWAIDPMADFWTTEESGRERDGAVYQDEDMPEVRGSTLYLGHCPDEVLDDFLYRIGDQATSMAEAEPFGAADIKTLGAMYDRIVAARKAREGWGGKMSRYRPCPTCRLYFWTRVWNRHVKACPKQQRKKKARKA